MKLLIDVNQLLWNGPILVMLFGTHVYFTLRLRLVQRKIGYGISLSLSDGSKTKRDLGVLVRLQQHSPLHLEPEIL